MDLNQIVVVTGIGEIRPYGSIRTRWEREVRWEIISRRLPGVGLDDELDQAS